MSWNPKAEPWRVAWFYRSNQPGLNGWASRVQTFPSEEAALEAINLPFKAGVLSADLDFALNIDNWSRNGRWLRLGGRKRKQQFVRKRTSPPAYASND